MNASEKYISSVVYNHVYTPEVVNKLHAMDEILKIVQEWKHEWGKDWEWDLMLEKYGGEYFAKIIEVIKKYSLEV